ncbi:hypothetical protein CRE_29299 [Caenorhabditis remanei]|uniref:Major sperm protein n=1 Tax=Caenorhabditis remanei TaxID=31234 RepID=E3MXY9_CAERE|nr:hypothetical protein CRE_29299 [Caenorhabditis remanei]
MRSLALARAARLEKLNRRSAANEVQMDEPGPQQNDEGVVIAPINQPNHGGDVGGAAEEVQAQNQENIAARDTTQRNDVKREELEVVYNPNNDDGVEQPAAGNQVILQPPEQNAGIEQNVKNEDEESDPRDTMPGRIQTTPENIITFNVPFEISQTHIMKIQNLSDRRMAFKMMSNCPDRLEFNPLFGTVKQGEFTYVKIKTKPFQVHHNFGDRIFVTWINAPRNGDIREDWFMERGTRSQKIMVVEYLS